MKRFKKQIVALIMMLALTTVIHAAVYEFHDDFDNGPDHPDEWVIEGESLSPPYPTGRYPIDASEMGWAGLSRSIGGEGDYICEVQLLNFAMIGQTSYYWFFMDNDAVGGGAIQMISPDTDSFVLQLSSFGTGVATIFSLDIGTTLSLGLRVTWEDDSAPGATGTYSAWYNQNDTGWVSMGSFLNSVDATPEREHCLYAGDGNAYNPCYMEIDSYHIVPEPASMILLALGSVCILKKRRAYSNNQVN